MPQEHQPPPIQELAQAIRAVDKHLPLSSIPPAHPDEIFYVERQVDPETKKEVVLWDDILQAFENAVQVRFKANIVHFLKGKNLSILEPRRFAAMPGTILDVIVNSPVVDRGLTSPHVEQQESTPVPAPPSYESTIMAGSASSHSDIPTLSASSTPSTPFSTNATFLRHNPGRGVEETTMNMDNVDIPLEFPLDQGLQAMVGDRTHVVENLPVISHQDNLNSLAPQRETTDVLVERDLDQISNSASHGCNEAQVALGDMYRHGHRVLQDYCAAMAWYLKAAGRGYAPAQYNIGDFYCLGHGVPQDFKQAMQWYLEAANQTHTPSLFSIGFLYYHGQGVPQDSARAMHWYLRAANRGYALAQHNLGLLYIDGGRGVRQDYAKAMDWYLKAAEQGHALSQYSIGLLYNTGGGVPQDYAKAMDWYLKAALRGFFPAQYSIGVLHNHGRGVPQSFAQAMAWYLKAAKHGQSCSISA